MSLIDKIKNYVKEWYNSDGKEYQIFIIVPKEEVAGIRKWLKRYTKTDEGNWFGYLFLPIVNTNEFCILMLEA